METDEGLNRWLEERRERDRVWLTNPNNAELFLLRESLVTAHRIATTLKESHQSRVRRLPSV